MNLKSAIAIAVAAAFAVPLAAQASADADKIIVAQQGTGSTYEPRDSNPAAPPKAIGPGAGSTNNQTGEVNKDRPASSAAGGQSSSSSTTGSTQGATGTTTAPLHSGTNSADRPANEPKSGAGATAKGSFTALDKNHDGYISRDEAKDATWSNRFTELDKDNDGRLSQSEFNAMQAGAGATGSNADSTTRQQNAPLTSGTNSADRKPNTPKQ